MPLGDGAPAVARDESPALVSWRPPPAEAEADLIAAATRPGASILELGAGAGRVTHHLVRRGLSVVAVDESAQMLSFVEGAETVITRIESDVDDSGGRP